MSSVKGVVKEALKNLGLCYVKMNDGSYNGRTVEPRTLALKGGSIGPLTVTSAYVTACIEVEARLIGLFERLFGFGEWSHKSLPSMYLRGGTDYTFIVKTGKKTVRVYKFTWQDHRTYASSQGLDPDYRTFWYELQTEDKHIIDVTM